VQDRSSVFCVDVDADHTVYWFLQKEKETAWANLFSTLWCSRSSSAAPRGSVLCLGSKSDLKYCPDEAREMEYIASSSRFTCSVEVPRPGRGTWVLEL